MIFLFFGSSLACLEPELELFEVWEEIAQMVFTPHPPSPYLGNVQIDGPHFINEASFVMAAEYFILVLRCDLVSVVDWVGRGGGNPA